MSIKDPATGAASPADAVVPQEPQAEAHHQAGVTPMVSPAPDSTLSRGGGASNLRRDTGDVALNGARPPPKPSSAAPGDPLLTPQDILDRLRLTSAEPAKWMRRFFKKNGVPYLHASGKMRATEAQYRMLLEKITCSPSGNEENTVSIISEAQSVSVMNGSKSQSSVQERIAQMLRRT